MDYLTGDTVFYEGLVEVARRYEPPYVFIFAGAATTKGVFYVTRIRTMPWTQRFVL
jgi:hypothetical protein